MYLLSGESRYKTCLQKHNCTLLQSQPNGPNFSEQHDRVRCIKEEKTEASMCRSVSLEPKTIALLQAIRAHSCRGVVPRKAKSLSNHKSLDNERDPI
jgi:hypothetical protein